TARRFEANPPSQRAGLRALDEALALRGALHDIFGSVIHGTAASAPALAEFNRHLGAAMAATEIAPEGKAFAWRWGTETMPPEGLLWPVARSAAELLTTGDLGRIKVCAGCFCGWMFYDKSRSGRRRWCEMEICGSRAKMRRYHQRQRDIAHNLH